MNTEKEQKEIEEKWQTERLEKQINFIREMDKEKLRWKLTKKKIFSDRHTCRGTEEMKMMPNTHGIWH